MTVIAIRDGIMAADTAVWCGDVIAGFADKIVRLKDGRLFAGAGDRPNILECAKWLDGEIERPAAVGECEFGALILAADGIFRIDYKFRIHPTAPAEFAVEGAHDEFMLGALHAGATAGQAVRLAIAHARRAGGDVQVEEL